MSYLMCLFLLGLMLGSAGVASNPSPFFAALGLVLMSGMGCGALMGSGGAFLSLVLFLIYLGGMLVVFAYSAALATDLYPESWVSWPVLMMMLFYFGGSLAGAVVFVEGWSDLLVIQMDEGVGPGVGLRDVNGVALVYSTGGGLLVGAGWVLLLTLFVVLELTRGANRGALRSV
nr:NADH dehydrogenase subunit 6 [Hypsoblennius hentz]